MKARAKDSKAKVSKRKMRSILMRWRAKLGAYPAKDLLPIVRYFKDKRVIVRRLNKERK